MVLMEDVVMEWRIWRVVLDVVVLLMVGISVPLIKTYGQIFKRGFFCDDDSLSHPFLKQGIMDSPLFHPIGCLIDIIVILLMEYFCHFKRKEKVLFWRFKVPKWTYTAYSVLALFAVGVLTNRLVTVALKGTIGRLRPYFLTHCMPNINCSLPENKHLYHTEYECTNPTFKANTRLSFPSGHCSFAMFCAVFLVVYLHKRFRCPLAPLLKLCIEVGAILAAVYVGMTRISDHKHHWSDVLGGFLIGGVCASIAMLHFCADKTLKVGGDSTGGEPERGNGGEIKVMQ